MSVVRKLPMQKALLDETVTEIGLLMIGPCDVVGVRHIFDEHGNDAFALLGLSRGCFCGSVMTAKAPMSGDDHVRATFDVEAAARVWASIRGEVLACREAEGDDCSWPEAELFRFAQAIKTKRFGEDVTS